MKLYNEKKTWNTLPLSLSQLNELSKNGFQYSAIKSRKKFYKKANARAWIKKQPNVINFYIHDVFQKNYYRIYYSKRVRRK